MRVLLVEDEARIAADIATTLEAAGYLVEITADGEDAWFRSDTEDYDLVVLDLGLPTMDGLAVLKRWRAGGRTMPVLVLTARGRWAERVSAASVSDRKGDIPCYRGIDTQSGSWLRGDLNLPCNPLILLGPICTAKSTPIQAPDIELLFLKGSLRGQDLALTELRAY